MPITGNESALAAQLTAAIVASIEQSFQKTIYQTEQQGIQALAQGIANALIPFLVTNTQVNVGQGVTVPAAGLTVTVTEDDVETTIPVNGTAMGTVNSSGGIS